MDDTISLVLRYDGTIDQFKLDALNDDGSIKSPQYKNKVVFIYGATQDSNAKSLIQSIWVSDSENGKFFDLASKGNAGGLMYGGTIENRANLNLLNPDEIYIKPTSSYKNKYNISPETEDINVTEENFLASGHEGEYFIVVTPNATDISGFRESFSWGELHFDVGDWFISNGNIWTKIDNTESVKSVGEMIGDISAESLARVLSSDKAGENKLATNAELTPINTKLTSINTELTSAQESISDVQESISNVQESILDINEIRSNASNAVKTIKLNEVTKSPNEHGVVDLGVISGGDGTHNALFCAGTITGALSNITNTEYYAKAKVNEFFEDKYGYNIDWNKIELEDGVFGKKAYLEPGEYKLICKGHYNYAASATITFVPIRLHINDKLSGWKDIFNKGFLRTIRDSKPIYGQLQAEPTSNSGYLDFQTDLTLGQIIYGSPYTIFLNIKEAGTYEFSGYTTTVQNDPNNYIIDEISLETKTTEVLLVRTKNSSLVDSIRQIQALDHQGCYFIMGSFPGTESIFGLGATYGDWIVAQGPSWVKVTTTDRTIAGITGNVSAEDLASKLSGVLNENLSLATKAEVVLIGNEDDSKDADTYYGLKKYIETGKTALFCAGRITALYDTGWATIGAEVEIYDAFKDKYGDNAPTITKVVLVDKRVIDGPGVSTTRFLFSGDYEGCYFVMGDFEGNDTIFELGATKGDWIISQNLSWAKIVTTRRDIAGFTGDVTDGQLANKLSQRSETNTTPLARRDELDGVIKGVKVNGESVDADENGVVDITKARANWEQENKSKPDYIENKPFGRADGIIISDIKDYDISGMTTPEEPLRSWQLYSSLPNSPSYIEALIGQGTRIDNSQKSGIEKDYVTVQVVSPLLAIVKAGTGYSGWLSTYPIELCWKNAIKKLDPKYLPDEAVKVGSESDTETAKTYYGLKRSFDSALESFDDLKVDKVKGKGLSTEDFTTLLKQKLESLQNYDDTAISAAIAKLRNDFDTLVKSDTSGAIDKFNEIIAFLDGIEDSESLDSIIASIEQQIASKANRSEIVQAVKINGEIKHPTEGIVDLGTIEGGNNDNTVVDFANDLTGRIEATPEEFTYRPSAGDKSVRDESAVIRRIKGNTSVWGQGLNHVLDQTGNNGWWFRDPGLGGNVRIDGNIVKYDVIPDKKQNQQISQRVDLKVGHTYLLHFTFNSNGVINDKWNRPWVAHFSNTLYGHDTETVYAPNDGSTSGIANIFHKVNKEGLQYIILKQPYVSLSEITPTVMEFGDIQIFDLTDIFGAGNESTTYEEFRQYYPYAYYPYCATEIRSMRATGIETIGFNAFNGEYAEVIGGQAYYLGGAIDTAHFATEIGGEMTEIAIPENRLYTPSTNGYIYATGSEICINLSHSGVRNGEYEQYEKNTLLLPEIAKYFPDGMHGIGDVCDEIIDGLAIQRIGEVDLGNSNIKYDSTRTAFYLRLYNSKTLGKGICPKFTLNNVAAINLSDGEMSFHNTYYDNTVIFKVTSYTDVDSFKSAMSGVKLYYELTEPIYTPIDEPLQLAYKVDDFGTERMLSDAPSAPFKADIVYQFNAEGRIRDNSRNIERLENKIRDIANVATGVALQRMVLNSTVTSLLPNVVYEGVQSYPNIEIPPLQVGKGDMRNVWKVFVRVQDGNINFPFNVKWKDGVAPTYSDYQYVELTFFDNILSEICGEWKVYK